jgi:HAD superfamily hydrolase (TIGR01662 family)
LKLPVMDLVDTILFDWDGTLIDTAQPSFFAFRKALGDLGISVDYGFYEQIYSPNWYAMYETLRLPREKWEEADRLWLRHYGEEIPEMVQGGMHVLNELCRRGYCLGIVSSGSQVRVQREINDLSLAEVFAVVVCNEDVAHKKPHPEGLEKAMRHMERQAESCCYVGDSPHDVEMGKRAGARTVGILSSYPSRRNLRHASPDFCCESIEDLLGIFETLTARMEP